MHTPPCTDVCAQFPAQVYSTPQGTMGAVATSRLSRSLLSKSRVIMLAFYDSVIVADVVSTALMEVAEFVSRLVISWLVGWLTDCLTDWLVCWLVELLVSA